jgi:Protein of unknown function (DUF2512).
MKHIAALIAKFLMVAAVLLIVLRIFSDLNMKEILLLSLAVTVITYPVGDLLILSVFNNTVAAVADAGMCWLIVYLSNYIWTFGIVSLLGGLLAAVFVGIGEIFLHIYIEKNIFRHKPSGRDIHIIR